MSEPVARQRPMIDLNEFERRLRRPAAAPPPRNEDPLAELARLVGDENDPYRGMFQEKSPQENYADKPVAQGRASGNDRFRSAEAGIRAERSYDPPRVSPSVSPRIPPHVAPRSAEPATWAARGPAPTPASEPSRGSDLPAASRSESQNSRQNLGGSFAAIEAGLRGSIQPEFRSSGQDLGQDDLGQDYASSARQHWNDELAPEEDDTDWLEQVRAMAPRQAGLLQEPPRSRRLLYVTAAIILVGIAGIGATFAIKRSPVSPRQIAMIKASTSPAKIQAPASAASDGAKIIQDASVLDKTPQSLPEGVVNRTEQPVDLAQTEALSAKGPAPQSAASVPVPQPPVEAGSGGQATAASDFQGRPDRAQAGETAPGQAFGLGGVIQAKKVKTVTVRPDGTIVSDDAPAEMAPVTAGSAPATLDNAANAIDATPRTAGQATTSGAQAAERRALVADRNGSDATAEAPVKAQAAERAKPPKVADVGGSRSDTATLRSDSADFSVQLAAPATEAEARNAIGKLVRQYGSVLKGQALKWHRAKVNGKSVYRVRVSGLSKPAAVTLCEALKAKGGSCFVARN